MTPRLIGLSIAVALCQRAGETAQRVKETVLQFKDTGELITPVPEVRAGESLRIEIVGDTTSLWLQFEKGKGEPRDPWILTCQFHGKDAKKEDPNKKDTCDEIGQGHELTLPKSDFMVYNIIKKLTPPSDIEKKLIADTQTASDALKSKLDDAKAALAKIDVDQLNRKIAQLRTEIKDLGNVSAGVTVSVIEQKQRRIRKLSEIVEPPQRRVHDAQVAADAAEKTLTQLRAKFTAKSEVLHAGVLIVNAGDRRVFWFQHKKVGGAPARLEQFGPSPVLTVKDRPYLVVVNKKTDDPLTDLRPSFSTETGAFVDVAPVRPTVDQGIKTSEFKREQPAAAPIVDFSDIVLTSGRTFPGETVLKVTISGYMPVVTSDKTTTSSSGATTEIIEEKKMYDLVSNAQLGQVHSLYHYNLSSGVVYSWLEDESVSRVKITGGTAPTYQTVAKYTHMAKPVLAFSAYLWPRDVQVPWNWRDWRGWFPAPTVGFSLSSPADDFFFGGSCEIRRNVQLVGGIHYGRVTRVDDIQIDPTSDAVPPTFKRFARDGFIGLTFNLNFIRGLFGK
jgi:hypothetical protein